MMTDDYIPRDHRALNQLSTSSFASFMHLLKASAGSGVLFLPCTFKKTGYVAALVCSVIISIICIHTAVLTIRCSQILCKRSRVPALNLAETAAASFRYGPKLLRRFADTFGRMVNASVCLGQYQTSIVYMIYVSTSFKQIIEYFGNWYLDVRLYMACFLPLFLLLALAPSFNFLTPFSVAGSFFLVTGFAVAFSYFIRDFRSPARLPAITDLSQLGVYSSVFMFSIYNMSLLMPLENTMKRPENMSWLLASGMMINALVCIAFGFLGYNKYEDEACDTVIKNLPIDELPAQLVKVSVTLSVLFTFGLHYYIPINILWPMIAEKFGNKLSYELCFRLGGVIVCALVGIILPYLTELVSLFSAASTATLMMLFPALIEISTTWNDPGMYRRTFMMMKNFIILFIYLLILFFGSRESVRSIMRKEQAILTSEPIVCQ